MSARPRTPLEDISIQEAHTAIKSVRGYHLSSRKRPMYWLLLVFTIGLVHPLSKLVPKLFIWLRLELCDLAQATFIECQLGPTERSVLIRVSVVDLPELGQTVALTAPWLNRTPGGSLQSRLLQYEYHTYYCDNSKGCFMLLPAMPPDLPDYISEVQSEMSSQALPASLTGPQSWIRMHREVLYGTNTIQVHIRSISYLLMTSLVDPFCLFQIASITVWIAIEYYIYAGFVLVATWICILINTLHVHKHLRQLAAAARQISDVTILTEKGVDRVSSCTLVPGDCVCVAPGPVPADMVLVRGECVVDESMLTGEGLQLRKVHFSPTMDAARYDPTVHVYCTLMGGSSVIKCTEEPQGTSHVLGVVIRTGYYSTRGDMFRSVLMKYQKKETMLIDSLRFILVMVVLLVVFFIWSAVRMARMRIATITIVKRFFDLMTCAIPPVLPVVLNALTALAMRRLRARGVTVTHPESMHQAGKVDLVCFDKTGTLTEPSVDLKEVLAVVEGLLEGINTSPSQQDHKTCQAAAQVMACCHGLALDSGNVVGDPLDLQLYVASGWKMSEGTPKGRGMRGPLWVVPPSPVRGGPPIAPSRLLRHFPYTSATQRQMMVVQCGGQLRVLLKGAPEVVAALVGEWQLPVNFDQVVQERSQEGLRVVALAVGKPERWGRHELKQMQPHMVESLTSFQLVGLALLSNPLRPDSRQVICQLMSVGLRCVMVTGDHLHTAIAMAQQCGMMVEDRDICVVEASRRPRRGGGDGPGGGRHVEEVEYRVLKADGKWCRAGSNTGALQLMAKVMASEMECAISGLAMKRLLRSYKVDVLQVVLARAAVFARMTPEDKRQLVLMMGKGLPEPRPSSRPYPHLNCQVAFCGDGSNDLGALKVAHVGLALSEGSVTASLICAEGTLSAVLEVLMEGRNSLTGMYQILQFMAGYATAQAFATSLSYSHGLLMSNNMVLVQDLAFATPLALLMAFSQPAAQLSELKVARSTLALSLVLPTVLQLSAAMAFQAAALGLVCVFVGCEKKAGQGLRDFPAPQTTVVSTMVLLQLVVFAVVFHRGQPHRQPVHKNYYLMGLMVAQVAFTLFCLFSVNTFTHGTLGLADHGNRFGFQARILDLVLMVGYVVLAAAFRAMSP